MKAKAISAADAFKGNSTSILAEMLAIPRRMNEKRIQCVDRKFILGSSAEVQRPFSNPVMLLRKIVMQ